MSMALTTKSEPKNILAIDDIEDNLLLVEMILDNANYHLTVARSGPEGLAKIAESIPDLLLLDVIMPGMNGYEVAQKIRQDSDLPYIPILLLSAHDHVSLVEGLDTGADDFIRKPFDIDELTAKVRSLLHAKQAIDM